MSYGLASILEGIKNQRKSRTGAAFSGTVLNDINDIIYEPTIEPGWASLCMRAARLVACPIGT